MQCAFHNGESITNSGVFEAGRVVDRDVLDIPGSRWGLRNAYNLQLACVGKLEVTWLDVCEMPRRSL